MGIPLSVLRGARLPGEAWSPRDSALAQAAEMLDRSRCAGCGQPTWLSHDPKSLWAPDWSKCEACDSIEELKSAAKSRVPKLHALLEGENARPQTVHFSTEHRGFVP